MDPHFECSSVPLVMCLVLIVVIGVDLLVL